MNRLIAVVVVVVLSINLLPALAFAGAATNAALGLGAFAVFNQIIGGVGIFGHPAAAYPPTYDPTYAAAFANGRADAREEHIMRSRERGYVAGQRGESPLVCRYELDPLAASGCDAAWRTGNAMWRDAEAARAYHSGFQSVPR